MATSYLTHPLVLAVEGREAKVHLGGRGDPLLLVHGGWGSATAHWAPVWEQLSRRFRVIAPELPGLGDTNLPALTSLQAYARWTASLLDALDVPSAWCVGNSFGASVVSRFAADFPHRCHGLILVDGFPMPPTPPLLRMLGRTGFGHRVMEKQVRRNAYQPQLLERGFADPAHAPPELSALVADPSPRQLHSLVEVMINGGGRPAPLPPPLLLWGERDRLWRTDPDSARRLQASWPGSTLVFIAGAGHMPQVENPAGFVRALEAFVDARSGTTAMRPQDSAPLSLPSVTASRPIN
jgi:pimeloyl-ACP methyl ester carboxylesterase